MARPLTKRTKKGQLYARPPDIERQTDLVLKEPLERVLDHAWIHDVDSPDYVASECLVHLFRNARRQDDQQAMNALVLVLLTRCERLLLPKISNSRRTHADELREEVLQRFSDLLAADCSHEDQHALDYYEVRFNRALAKLRVDVIREDHRKPPVTPLPEIDDEVTSMSDESRFVQLASSLHRPTTDDLRGEKQALHVAIDTLPEDERSAVVLRFLMGYPVESDDPAKETVASRCGVSGRTIRERLKRAYARLTPLVEGIRL